MMQIITLDDSHSRIDITVFPEAAERYRDLLKADQLVVIEAEVSEDRFSGGLRVSAKTIDELSKARAKSLRVLKLQLHQQQVTEQMLHQLKLMLQAYSGDCPVEIIYQTLQAHAKLKFGSQWHVHPDDAFLQKLRELISAENVIIDYR